MFGYVVLIFMACISVRIASVAFPSQSAVAVLSAKKWKMFLVDGFCGKQASSMALMVAFSSSGYKDPGQSSSNSLENSSH